MLFFFVSLRKICRFGPTEPNKKRTVTADWCCLSKMAIMVSMKTRARVITEKETKQNERAEKRRMRGGAAKN
jgi:hypothetical protein